MDRNHIRALNFCWLRRIGAFDLPGLNGLAGLAGFEPDGGGGGVPRSSGDLGMGADTANERRSCFFDFRGEPFFFLSESRSDSRPLSDFNAIPKESLFLELGEDELETSGAELESDAG